MQEIGIFIIKVVLKQALLFEVGFWCSAFYSKELVQKLRIRRNNVDLNSCSKDRFQIMPGSSELWQVSWKVVSELLIHDGNPKLELGRNLNKVKFIKIHTIWKTYHSSSKAFNIYLYWGKVIGQVYFGWFTVEHL